MIDVSTEDLLTFPGVARFLPGRPSLSTLHRWRQRGIRGVALETLLIGGQRYTSREALQRFFDASTAAADRATAPSRPNAARATEVSAARKELQAAGILD
mgnify:CR=1 FL=1